MRHHHVAVGAGLLVEGAALAQAQRLGHVDLHVVDEVAVPDRLEQAVGEAKGQDVLGRLLAQEMVDAEDALFVEDLVQFLVQRHRAGQVGAEGLFHDDAGVLHQPRLGQQAHRRQRRTGRHAEVVQAAALGAQRGFGPVHRGGQGLGAGRQRHVVQQFGKRRPVGVAEFPAEKLIECAARRQAEAVGVQVVERHADDAATGDEPRVGQVEQARQQLAPRQVAGGAEQHDHLRKLRTDAGRNLGQGDLLVRAPSAAPAAPGGVLAPAPNLATIKPARVVAAFGGWRDLLDGGQRTMLRRNIGL